MKADTTNNNRLVLFVRSDCEFCAQVLKMIEEVRDDIEFSIYKVFNSRVKGKTEIRNHHGSDAGLPLLVNSWEIPGVPCLYDPLEDEKIIGIVDIEQYFIECGVLPEDDEY